MVRWDRTLAAETVLDFLRGAALDGAIVDPHAGIQHFEDAPLLSREPGRSDDEDRHEQIPLPPAIHAGHSRAAQAEGGAVLSSLGDSQLLLAGEGRNPDFRAESRLRDGDGDGVVEIAALPVKVRMLADAQHHVKIAVRSTHLSRFAFAAHAQTVPVLHASGNLQA